MKNVARPSSDRQNGYTLGEAFWRGRLHFAAFSYVLCFSILRVSSSDGTVSRAFHHGFKRPKTCHVFSVDHAKSMPTFIETRRNLESFLGAPQ